MYTDGEQMYTTHGHIIIAMTAGHRAPCLHPTPNADSPHRATERATGDAEQTGKADTHGGTQGQPGRQTQPERGQDRMESRRAPEGMLGRSDRRGDGGTGQDPQTVRATQSRPGCRRGYSYHRRRRRGAESDRTPSHDTIYKAREGQPKPPN